MNILPTMEVQAVTHLLQEPSPFSHFDEAKKQFGKPGDDPFWKQAVMEKFEWAMILSKNTN